MSLFKTKYYLIIPYDKKDIAKEHKCLWDNDEKKYVEPHLQLLQALFKLQI